MLSSEFSSIRRDVVSGVEEVGGFLLDLMDSERVAEFNSNLQQRNFKVIRWLREHGAPQEMIGQAEEDAAQGNNAILTVYDEIRLRDDYSVVPTELLELFLEAAGPRAQALFRQLCEEYSAEVKDAMGKDYREKPGRQ